MVTQYDPVMYGTGMYCTCNSLGAVDTNTSLMPNLFDTRFAFANEVTFWLFRVLFQTLWSYDDVRSVNFTSMFTLLAFVCKNSFFVLLRSCPFNAYAHFNYFIVSFILAVRRALETNKQLSEARNKQATHKSETRDGPHFVASHFFIVRPILVLMNLSWRLNLCLCVKPFITWIGQTIKKWLATKEVPSRVSLM